MIVSTVFINYYFCDIAISKGDCDVTVEGVRVKQPPFIVYLSNANFIL